jgi:hypothetical protein
MILKSNLVYNKFLNEIFFCSLSVLWTMDEKDENRCIFSLVILVIKPYRQNTISYMSCMLIFDKTYGLYIYCYMLEFFANNYDTFEHFYIDYF